MNITQELVGVIPALITPCKEDGTIDFKVLEKQVAYLSSAGVQGIFINGTTGEGAYLTTEEKRELFKVVKEVVGEKQFLCAACLQPSTSLVIDEMKALEALQPDFIVAVTPYYYTVSQEIIVQHFRVIAQYASAPVILYNIPSCTHNPMTLETIRELADVENIAGIKDSSGDFITFTRGISTPLHSDFVWIQGEDYLDAPSYFLGARGSVTGVGNICVEPYLAMYRAAVQGNANAIIAAQKRINAIYDIASQVGGKLIPFIKAAATLLGRGTRWMKTPGFALKDYEIAQIKQRFGELGVLE